MNKHHIWMILGCVLPVLFLFASPMLGLKSSVTVVIFLVIMFLCSLMMIVKHDKNANVKNINKRNFKTVRRIKS